MRYYFTMLDFSTVARVTHTHTQRHYTTLHYTRLHEAGNLGSDGVNDSQFAGTVHDFATYRAEQRIQIFAACQVVSV